MFFCGPTILQRMNAVTWDSGEFNHTACLIHSEGPEVCSFKFQSLVVAERFSKCLSCAKRGVQLCNALHVYLLQQ